MNALTVVTYFRGMRAAGWTYRLNTHQWGAKITDCQGAVDWVAMQNGFSARLGAVLPYNVSRMVNNTTFPIVYPPEVPYAGDILVLGNPAATDIRLKYAHTGMATTPGMYVSAYNEHFGFCERKIDNIPTMKLVLIIRTGLSGGAMLTGPIVPAQGRITLLSAAALPAKTLAEVDPAMRLFNFGDGDLMVPDAATFDVSAQTTVGPGQVTPKYKNTTAEAAWIVAMGGGFALVLARNAAPLEPIVKPVPFTFTVSGVVNPDGTVTFGG